MNHRETTEPIPINENVHQRRSGNASAEALERVRMAHALSAVPRPGLGRIGWILLAPFLVVGFFVLLGLLVCVGAAIERALAGG